MERKLKSPELLKAKKKLIAFIEDNNLNPSRDYSNHPKYGKEFSNLLFNLTKERQKIEKVYPELDRRGQIKHIKMIMEKKKKKAAQKEAARELKGKGNVKITEKKKKETKETKVKRCKYDYPLVNGHEMSPDQKKKYRMEQRKLANGGSPKPKVEKEETKASKKKEEKVSKVKKTPKVDKVKKTKKKVKKEED